MVWFVVFAVTAVALTCVAVGYPAYRLWFRGRAVQTTGVIAGRKYLETSDRGRKLYELTVSFETPDGRNFTFTETSYADYHERVPVLYDPAKPSRAALSYTLTSVALITAVLVMAAALFDLGIIAWWRSGPY
jgi:hypothetical protein